MRDPIRLKLEYLASTYGIEDLGLAWIEYKPDGTRSLILCEVMDSVAYITHEELRDDLPFEDEVRDHSHERGA